MLSQCQVARLPGDAVQLDEGQFDLLVTGGTLWPCIQEYFDQQGKSLKSRVRLVRDTMVRSLDNCYAEVLKDADILFTASSGK